jgi:tripartite-type tricarboxylate transporter receptor subunit TctC
LREPDIAARLTALGLRAVGNSPDEAAAYVRSESERWREIITKGKIKGL